MTDAPRVLVVGAPRSATSWVGRVLGATAGATYLGEPDNHEHCAFALRAKRRISRGFFPALGAEDAAPDYELLWRAALEGPPAGTAGVVERIRGRMASRLLRDATPEAVLRAFRSRPTLALRAAEVLAVPERPQSLDGPLVVKSVHAQLALEWIAARWPVVVVVVLRNPLAVMASWQTMGWLDGRLQHDMLHELDPAVQRVFAERAGSVPPADDASRLTRSAWLLGVLLSGLHGAIERHPGAIVVEHERLCADPHTEFRAAAEALSLHWDEGVDRLLDDMNRPGTGYETNRVAASLPDGWRSHLNRGQVDEIQSVLDRFPALSSRGGAASA